MPAVRVLDDFRTLLVKDGGQRGDDSHRTGTADTPVCECGLERETAEHFLLCCPRFHEARNKLTDTLKEISDLSGRKKMLHLSETLLLAPFRDEFTNKEDKVIKEALFQFIRDTKKSEDLALLLSH